MTQMPGDAARYHAILSASSTVALLFKIPFLASSIFICTSFSPQPKNPFQAFFSLASFASLEKKAFFFHQESQHRYFLFSPKR
ncbi:MAG: hypothetical protein VB133_02955 [Anaeromusa sp.]|uniref:hypothetical protein n=1 Tax=Anaeromusa sp. TaxID=1872520 RepID=UPI002B2149D0|nr:hypothetical protein [Anaeromusa sp.]MEA4834087.1 hypothetical protein [Anaeromusa sp.]NCB77007.1 hypothetical protein [Negativicutes bacterium]